MEESLSVTGLPEQLRWFYDIGFLIALMIAPWSQKLLNM